VSKNTHVSPIKCTKINIFVTEDPRGIFSIKTIPEAQVPKEMAGKISPS
jgi:hypothetical protein